MSNNINETVFGGLDPSHASGVPGWYRAMTDSRGVDVPNFRDALNGLELATKVDLAYLDPEDVPQTMHELQDEFDRSATPEQFLENIGVITSGKYRALVNPNWLGRQNREAADMGDAMWQPPTDQYVPVNPMDAYGPLIAVTRQRGHGDARVFGEIREYHHGGEVHMDIFFEDVRTQIPNGPEFIWGVTTGYDFRGYHSHYAHLIAVDPERKVVYRRLYPNAGKRRHVGPRSGQETATEDVSAWWVDIFDHLEAATDALLTTVAEAEAYSFNLDDYDDVEVIFAGNGLGPYAEDAAKHVGPGSFPAAYDLFYAAAKALDKEFNAKVDGSAAKDYTNAANRFLFSPQRAEAKALRHQQELLDDLENLTPEDAERKGDLADRLDSLGEKTETARSFRKRLRDILDAAEEANDEDDDEDSNGEQADLEEVAA